MTCRGIHTAWLVVMTLLVLGGRPVHGEWLALERHDLAHGLQTIYVDPATMQRDGDRVTLWQLTDYRWKQGAIVGRRFLSSKTQKQFDCPARRYRLLAFINFSGRMGTGDPRAGYVDHNTWLPVEPGSMNHALWNVACRRE